MFKDLLLASTLSDLGHNIIWSINRKSNVYQFYYRAVTGGESRSKNRAICRESDQQSVRRRFYVWRLHNVGEGGQQWSLCRVSIIDLRK